MDRLEDFLSMFMWAMAAVLTAVLTASGCFLVWYVASGQPQEAASRFMADCTRERTVHECAMLWEVGAVGMAHQEQVR